MPLGVQNIFIFNQGAIHRNLTKALPAILTAAVCDTALITLAVIGVSAAVLSLPWLNGDLIGVGISFMVYMGYVTWTSKVKSEGEEDSIHLTWKKQVAFAASVSLLNPHAILDTIKL
nr:LysE family transporter [Mesobacillus harenae]